jgi:hypothetical protein
VTTRLAWSTVRELVSRRVAIARHRAPCRSRRSTVGSTSTWTTAPPRSGAKTGRSAKPVTALAQFVSRGHPIVDMAGRVTQDLIEDGMARVETLACSPGDDSSRHIRALLSITRTGNSWVANAP